ncbi:hypothetical protein F4780DRAFT_371994 [Xylariomycetidae sp. FL0641]|nr:hypothetical protein F4780DRAFT_371994 [Xylariomycetidae sp. FL0641]
MQCSPGGTSNAIHRRAAPAVRAGSARLARRGSRCATWKPSPRSRYRIVTQQRRRLPRVRLLRPQPGQRERIPRTRRPRHARPLQGPRGAPPPADAPGQQTRRCARPGEPAVRGQDRGRRRRRLQVVDADDHRRERAGTCPSACPPAWCASAAPFRRTSRPTQPRVPGPRRSPPPRPRHPVRADEALLRPGDAGPRDLFAPMAAAERGLSKLRVRLEAPNLVLAGADTTSVTLTDLVWAVLKRPALQRRLEEELAGLRPDFRDAELEALPLRRRDMETLRRRAGKLAPRRPRGRRHVRRLLRFRRHGGVDAGVHDAPGPGHLPRAADVSILCLRTGFPFWVSVRSSLTRA